MKHKMVVMEQERVLADPARTMMVVLVGVVRDRISRAKEFS